MGASSSHVLLPGRSILAELYEERKPRSPAYSFSRALRTFLFIGGIYFLYIELGGIGIPCPFRLLTGLKCPGCGVTTMLVDLMKLDVLGAFEANPVLLFLLAPSFLLIVLLEWKGKKSKAVRVLCTVLLSLVIAILIAWGIVRNIPGLL